MYYVFLGFIVTLIIRLLGGETYLGWRAAVAFPGYDEETNTQYFPFKTMAMLIGFGLMLAVSYLTHWAMTTGRLDAKWLRYINNKVGALVPSDEMADVDTSTDREVSLKLMNSMEAIDSTEEKSKFT